MENMRLNVSKNIELVNFIKVDNQTNLCVLYDHESKEFIVAWNLKVYRVVSYTKYGSYKARYKAEKIMNELNQEYLINEARKEAEESEKRFLWDQFKL